MQESVGTLSTLVQAGAVGISIALIWLVYKLVVTLLSHFQDTVSKNTEAWNKTTEALTALSTKIDKL